MPYSNLTKREKMNMCAVANIGAAVCIAMGYGMGRIDGEESEDPRLESALYAAERLESLEERHKIIPDNEPFAWTPSRIEWQRSVDEPGKRSFFMLQGVGPLENMYLTIEYHPPHGNTTNTHPGVTVKTVFDRGIHSVTHYNPEGFYNRGTIEHLSCERFQKRRSATKAPSKYYRSTHFNSRPR